MPITELAGLQAALQQAAATGAADLQKQMHTELEKSAKAIAVATPRTQIRHQHMDESYSVEGSGNSLDLVNSRPYARSVFEAQRRTADAAARQKRLNAATDKEVARLAATFDGTGVSIARKVGQP